jgi:hypothetical protein
MKTPTLGLLPLAALWLGACAPAPSPGPVPSSLIQPTGKQKPVDSKLRVRVGETAPDFTLPAVSGSLHSGLLRPMAGLPPGIWNLRQT